MTKGFFSHGEEYGESIKVPLDETLLSGFEGGFLKNKIKKIKNLLN